MSKPNVTFGINELRDIEEWRTERAAGVFRSRSSLNWFCKNHRTELLDSGQLILGRGSARSLIGPGFEDLVMEIKRRETAEIAGLAAASTN
jgi:hypothetical protein